MIRYELELKILTNKLSLKEAFEEMELYYGRMMRAHSTTGAKQNLEYLLKIYNNKQDELKKFWVYNPDEYYVKKRFQKIANHYEIPPMEGLYLVGETSFNPLTDEIKYFLKVGCGHDIKQRLKQYKTYTPTLQIIDTLNTSVENENFYHNLLEVIGIKTTTEWFEVSKENYIQALKKGFDFFKNMLDND